MEIETARQFRTVAKTRLTKFRTFLDKCLNEDTRDSIQVEEIQLRLKKIEEVWHEYDKAQNVLEMLAPGPTREADRTEFEDNYFKSTAMATKIINDRLPRGVGSGADSRGRELSLQQRTCIAQLEAELLTQRQAELSNLRELLGSRSATPTNEGSVARFPLPKLDLPTFTGNYEDWLGFKDSFVAVIHSDASIPKIQKLRYLKSYIKGNAAKMIENLQTTEANYDIAWNFLDERFNNTRLIIQNHMQALFDLASLSNKDSTTGFRHLLDNLLGHVRALEALKEPVNEWDTPLVCLIVNKLDRESRREWERSVKGSGMPTFAELVDFLREKCQVLEAIHPEYIDHQKINAKTGFKGSSNIQRNQMGKTFVNTQTSNCCSICGGDHYVWGCGEFVGLSVDERIQLIKKKGLCYNCLKGNHLLNNCRSRNCTNCGRRHHTLLHLDKRVDSNLEKTKEDVNKLKNCHILDASRVMLSTALVDIFNVDGNAHTCRVLLDNGSQPNLITSELAEKLKLKRRRLESLVEVINNQETVSREWVVTRFQSRTSSYATTLNFLVFSHITGNLPAAPINKENLKIPNHIKLSDPNFNEPSKVEVLIGGELFYDLLCSGKITLALPRTYAHNTRLGWIITGKANFGVMQQRLSCNLITEPLSQDLERFWNI